MALLKFTANLAPQIDCPEAEYSAGCVRELLNKYFTEQPQVRGYVLDDQGAVRKHIMILINGLNLRDRAKQGDPLAENSEVYVFQALSGG